MSIAPSMRGTGTIPAPERRGRPRRSVMDQRLVTVNLDNKDAGLMVNISETGMAVQALARIRPGAATVLQFELPDSAARIETSGTVAWVDPTSGRAGIRFENLSSASAECLSQWLNRQASPRRPTTSAVTVAAATSALLGPQSKVAEVAALQREITSTSLDRDQALGRIVERARSLTRADGAAIVLGDSKLMTCRASSGSAPPVDSNLRPDSGLSGECVRTGVTVRCEDTELDPRVDRDACRSLNLRSAVIVPLFSRGNISGLLEVFYASARAFEGRDVLTLRRMADLISATLCGPVSREVKPPAPAFNAVEPDLMTNPNTPANRDPVRSEPRAPARPEAPGPMIPPVPRAAPKAGKVVCDVCGHENPHATSDCEKCDVPLPAKVLAERARAARSASQQPQLVQPQREKERPRPTPRANIRPRLLILIAVLLVLVSIWGWQEYKSRQVNAAPPTSTTSAVELPAPTVVSAAAPDSLSEPVLAAAKLSSSSIPASFKASAARAEKNNPPMTTVKDVVFRASPKGVAEKPSGPVFIVSSQPQAGTQAAVAPPPLAVTASIPLVATLEAPPVVAPALSRAIVSPAQLIHKVEPQYPALAQASRVQGAVVLKATILRSGRLGMIQVISGNELLVGAAVHAVQQWRYKPMELDGKPAEMDTTISVKFSLGSAR